MPFKELIQRTFFLQLLVSLLLVAPVRAQLNSGSLFQLTEKEGLPSNLVSNVFVDRMGYVWIASPNGLARYNGYEFERFYSNRNDSTAIHGMIVYSIMQNSRGNIWMGTNPAFVERYDPATHAFKSYYFGDKYSKLLEQSPLYGFVVSSICEGDNGTMYFGIATATVDSLPFGLLCKMPGEDSLSIVRPPGNLAVGSVDRMRKDPFGNIWIWSQTGVFRINKAGKLSEETALFSAITFEQGDSEADAQFDAEGNLWILCRFGDLIELKIADGGAIRYRSPFQSGINRLISTCLAIDKAGVIWIGRKQGIEQYLPGKKEFRIFNSGVRKNLEQVFVNDFAFDDFGNVFIGTTKNGLLRYENKAVFHSILSGGDPGKSLRFGWVDFIYQAADRKIWLHSDSGFCVLDPKSSFAVTDPNPSIQKGRAIEMWEQSPGVYVFAHVDGTLLKYTAASGKAESFSLPGLPSNAAIFKHLRDKRGNIWLATRSGLYRKSPDAVRFRRYDLTKWEAADFNSNAISDLVEDKKNSLWIITNNGLFRYLYDRDSIVREGYGKQKDEVFISQDINSFYEDANGNFWVGLWQGGLAKYDPATGKVHSYTVDDGLPSMGVQGLVGDEKGNVWISTFNGISRFDPAKQTFINFSTEDGIQGSLFADASYLKTASGIIMFGGSNGLTYFNPNDFVGGYTKPKVYLTDLKLFGKSLRPDKNGILKKPIYETKKVVLRHDQNNLAIDFVAIHYSNPKKNKYAYTLESYDNGWREGTNQHQAYYPNLQPGTYTFRVKAASDKGVWNEEGATLIIVVKSPWWQTWWAYSLYVVGAFLLVLGFIRWRTAYLRREKRSLENKVAERTDELNTSLKNLKATQSQLIQTEKMASLGELTAGIAHEIQNPLNFVNNFAEVNSELIEELKEELESGHIKEASAIADEIAKNEKKITGHGKRADAIVKGMLQHSRSSSGQKEPTDINALCDEYLRLAYHGYRAKDKSFNADFKTEPDPAIGLVNVVPQDIGRVILNLVNNAFHAVAEKATAHPNSNYLPIVTIETKKLARAIEIRVSDNGNGIPEVIREKIFQPFFTTKPTGSGTGLGLSLSYDIVKAHGGEIKLASKEGEGTVFILQLPFNS